jgi:hypothetical protein
MMRKGVKNLILPSRSGPKAPAASDLLEELRRHGVNAKAPICDVSSRESLTVTLEECAKSMPPVKGCINACMTLQVYIILVASENNMTDFLGRTRFSKT